MIKRVKEFYLFDEFHPTDLAGRKYRIERFLNRRLAVLKTGFEGCAEPWALIQEKEFSLAKLRSLIAENKILHVPAHNVFKKVYLRISEKNLNDARQFINGIHCADLSDCVNAAIRHWVVTERARRLEHETPPEEREKENE